MALIPTSTAIVQSFAGALYGKQIGSVTLKAVSSDINNLGLNTTLNSYFSYSFGSMTAAQVADLMVTNLGIVDGKANAAAYVVGQLNAVKPAVWGQTISGILAAFSSLTSDATYGAAASAWNSKIEAAAAYTGAADVSISEIVSVFPLSISQTDSIPGTAGNDIVNAFDGYLGLNGTTPVYLNTLNGSDAIDGGAGNDTINVSTTIAAAYTLPTSVTVKNVETLNLQTDAQAIAAADVSNWVGLQTVNVKMTGTAAALTALTTKGNVTSVTIDNVASAGVTDSGAAETALAPAADTLSTVTVKNVAGLTTVTSDAAKTINLTSSNGGATVVAVAPLNLSGRSIAFNLSKVTAGTLTDATATAVTVDSTGLATGASANTVAALTTGAAKAVSLTGASPLTITADTLDSKVVITSTNTGGVTLTQALTANQQFNGTASSGADTISVPTAFATAITTGAGNDTVTYAGPAATGGSIDAGEGSSDTIKMTAAIAATATASTTFAGTVAGFEVLELSAATGAATAIDMANADGINSLVTNGVASGNALTVTNAAAGFTYTSKALTAAASSIALKTATGTDDTVNLVYTSADGFSDTAATTVTAVENLNIKFTDSDGTVNTNSYSASITGTTLAKVTLSGNVGATLVNTDTTITSVDATALAGLTAASLSASPPYLIGLTWTSGALAAAADIKGSTTGKNTVTFSAATKAVTYTGGAGDDVITASNNNNNVVSLLGGDNQLTAGNGNNTVTLSSDKAVAVDGGATGNKIVLGNGNNTVTDTGTKGAYVQLGTGANTVTLGSGNDFVKIGAAAGVNVIDVGSGTDTVIINGIQTAAGYYTTITGFGVGDKLDLAATTTTASAVTPLGAKITLGPVASFANYLDAATATDLSTSTGTSGSPVAASAAVIKWFQFSGNTYVVVDNATVANYNSSDTVTFQDGVDSVICLTGLIDLSTSTVASDVITVVAPA